MGNKYLVFRLDGEEGRNLVQKVSIHFPQNAKYIQHPQMVALWLRTSENQVVLTLRGEETQNSTKIRCKMKM